MITTSHEYWQVLYRIQDLNFPEMQTVGPVPKEELIYNVDLNSRIINAPKFVGVEKDLNAEWIYFKCPRYYDTMDLSNTCGVIQFYNAHGEDRFYPLPFYYPWKENNEDYILLPWKIDLSVTEYKGSIEFAIRFYLINSEDRTFAFSLNTLPAKTQVLYGIDTVSENKYNFEADKLNLIYEDLNTLKKDYVLYWVDVE